MCNSGFSGWMGPHYRSAGQNSHQHPNSFAIAETYCRLCICSSRWSSRLSYFWCNTSMACINILIQYPPASWSFGSPSLQNRSSRASPCATATRSEVFVKTALLFQKLSVHFLCSTLSCLAVSQWLCHSQLLGQAPKCNVLWHLSPQLASALIVSHLRSQILLL